MHITPDEPPWPLWVRWTIGLSPVVFWLAMLWYAWAQPRAFLSLTREDGPIESAQAILLIAGAVIAARVAWRLAQSNRRKWAVIYCVVALGLVWAGGEEVSWGQRIFGVQAPDWLKSRNVQREMNLHNLPGVTEAIERWVFNWGVVALIFLASLARRLGRRRFASWQADLWVPHPTVIPAGVCLYSYVWLRKLYAWHYGPRNMPPLLRGLTEPRELIFIFVVVAFLAMVVHRLNRRTGDRLRESSQEELEVVGQNKADASSLREP